MQKLLLLSNSRNAGSGWLDAIVVVGGNTFNLLAEARKRKWLPAIRVRVKAGVPYMGRARACSGMAARRVTSKRVRMFPPCLPCARADFVEHYCFQIGYYSGCNRNLIT